jgi:uncharacterized protein YjbJ (UPF0337 family)
MTLSCLSHHIAGNVSVVGEEETLEEAVKGIATGIVGKAKQVAGELLGDPDLEAEGVAKQEEAESIRAGDS